MKIYISGAISSVVPGVLKEQLKERFHEAEAQLVNDGHNVVNPISVGACEDQHCVLNELMTLHPDKRDFAVNFGEHTWSCYMKYDIKAMLDCDAIYLLKDWHLSRGAMLELMVAQNCGLRVIFQ